MFSYIRSSSTKMEAITMEAILDELQVSHDDRSCLFAICLLDGMISNDGNVTLWIM